MKSLEFTEPLTLSPARCCRSGGPQTLAPVLESPEGLLNTLITLPPVSDSAECAFPRNVHVRLKLLMGDHTLRTSVTEAS